MQIFSELQRLAKHLDRWPGSWALCGGVVASIYRDTPRFTGDIDVALIDLGSTAATQIATTILSEMGYPPVLGFIPDPLGGGEQRNALLCGRGTNNERFVGVDFLLPIFPWVPKAVERAQSNLIDYGFQSLPTVTPEDLFLAKLNAIQTSASRPQDIDDLQSMMRANLHIDYAYISREARCMGFALPSWVTERV